MKHLITLCLVACGSLVIAQTINGTIYRPNGEIYEAVENNLTLHMDVGGCPDQSQDFNIDGNFSLTIIINPTLGCDSIYLSVRGDADAKAGVSTLDLVRLVKHLLGTQLFTNALQYIAADANNSESVSALDIVEIRKLILGHYVTWPKNDVFNFIHKTTIEPPVAFTSLRTVVALPINESATVNFWIVKTGDVYY